MESPTGDENVMMEDAPGLAASGTDVQSSSTAVSTSPASKAGDRHKLPRLNPSNKSRSIMLNSPPHYPASRQRVERLDERRRFINVVRPYSFFPEPALPPNYVLPVKSEPLYVSQLSNSSTRGRPPSPAPFSRQQQRRQTNFSVAGQGVGAGTNGYTNGSGSAALRVNLAGGSGWDLTAIRRGYNNGIGKSS